ncbi:glycosyltransferase family 4 protein [Benzoatithermus flavus]|uniref:Glycosyltransferase family 4 protein n=1 Tax=Benzoatithermus flavus TaxID=3108223 RepID=A0ABU8XQW8_9PROT
MHIAFHAPLKPPDHPVPSGDRRMARAFMDLLVSLGHEVELASRFRSYDRTGDERRQERLARIGRELARRLVRRYRGRPPEMLPGLWFTYHLYHKAPDWLGPVVSTALRIPYVVAEASVAPKQAAGPWAIGFAASRAAIARADLVLAMTDQDRAGLASVVSGPGRLHLFPPFLDTAPFAAAALARGSARARLAAASGLDMEWPWLVAVAMMRADAKLLSYRLLARALAALADRDWQLVVVGDGEARGTVEGLLAPLGAGRVHFTGAVPPEALAGLLAACDLCVWPACNEAYGMALLEAQAAGLPVVAGAEGGVSDIVVDGSTGILVRPRDPLAFADAVRTLLDDPERRRVMGLAARAHVTARHDVAAARARLRPLLEASRCVSA